MDGVGLLRNIELTDAAVRVVCDARGFEGVAILEGGLRHVTRAAVDGELSSADLEPGVCRLRSLQIDRLHVVMRSRIEAVAVGKTAPVPEKQDEYRNESDCTDATADGNRRNRIGIAASIRAIPKLPDFGKRENERPGGPKDWARITSGNAMW